MLYTFNSDKSVPVQTQLKLIPYSIQYSHENRIYVRRHWFWLFSVSNGEPLSDAMNTRVHIQSSNTCTADNFTGWLKTSAYQRLKLVHRKEEEMPLLLQLHQLPSFATVPRADNCLSSVVHLWKRTQYVRIHPVPKFSVSPQQCRMHSAHIHYTHTHTSSDSSDFHVCVALVFRRSARALPS